MQTDIIIFTTGGGRHLLNKGLRKELGFLDLTMTSLGAIIGSGWLFGSLYASQVAGPAAVVSWIIGGIAVMLIGLIYAELGGMIPESGGIARYPQYSHGHLTSFIMGWAAWIAYASVPAIEAEAVVQYASHYIPSLYNPTTGLLEGGGLALAVVLMLAFFAVNYFGVKIFAKVNTPVTLLKFVMPAATIIVFLVSGLHWSNLSSATGGFAPNGFHGVLQAVATSGVIFSYLGFRQAVDLAGEARNPQRDVPRAIITSIAIGIALYVLLQLVFIVAIPGSDLAKGWSGLSFSAPFAQVALALNLGWLATLLYADAVLSPAGTGTIYIASTSRVLYALANNGYFPKSLAKVDPKTGIPNFALIVALILGLIFLLPFPSWQSLVGMVSAATVLTYIIGPISLGTFRKIAPEAHRPFTLGGANIISPVAFVIGSLIIYWTGWTTDYKLLLTVLIGVVLYLVASLAAPKSIRPPDTQSLKSGVWLVVYLLLMLGMSYFGSARFGSPITNAKGTAVGMIHYPLDLVFVIVIGIVFYYWGVASGYKTKHMEEALEALAMTRDQGPGATSSTSS